MKRILLLCCLFAGIITAGFAQTGHTENASEKVKGLKKQLKLTDKQAEKLTAIYKESANKFDEIKKQEHGNTNKMLVAIAPLRKETIAKIKAVLTPAQKAKYEKLLKEPDGDSLNGGWSGGWTEGGAK